MTSEGHSREDQARKILELEKSLERAHEEINRLKSELAARVDAGDKDRGGVMESTLMISEVEVRKAIARQLRNGARLLRATKCVYLLFDGKEQLVAQRPALGLDEEQLRTYTVPTSRGISGEVFRTRKSLRCDDLSTDPRFGEEPLAAIGAKNGICVPLQVQIRDEENRVIDSRAIGALWVMNRRDAGGFSADDERLLAVFARQVAAVVSNAEIFTRILKQNVEFIATFESLPAGILYIGEDEQIRLINGSAREIFEVGENQGVGEPYYRTIRHQPTVEILHQALREKADQVGEAPLMVKGEERIFHIQAARVRAEDEAVSGVVAILDDVTEMHRVDQMKTEFVQTFSAELLGPLASIRGFSQMLRQSPVDAFERDLRDEVQEIITQECDRLRRHIQDLLNVSRADHQLKLRLNLSQFEFGALANRVVEQQRGQSLQHSLRLDLDPAVDGIVGDEARLEEVLFNLVSNAIKYSPDGGDVAVTVKALPDGVRVEVSDEGIGIPPEHHEGVFRRFSKVRPDHEKVRAGRGIGLFISQFFVAAHGGKMGLTSEVGKGSTFWFEVPAEPRQDEAPETEQEAP